MQRVAIKLTGERVLAQQRLELGGEGKPAVGELVIQRFDPVAVPRQQQPLLAAIPQRQGEHATQL